MTLQKLCVIFLFAFSLLLAGPLIGQDSKCLCEDGPLSWQGFYLNGQLGAGGNRQDPKFTNANYFNTLGSVVLGDRFYCKSNGFVAGGALGYNYQIGQYVFGVEAGALTTNLKTSKQSRFFPETDRFSSHLQCIVNAKGRFGYIYDTMLMFISGGWAGGREGFKLIDASSFISASLRTWANGWTVGAGFECKLTPCYSMGLGYDFVQLEYKNKAASCSSCGIGVGLGSPKINERSHVQILTVRLSYFYY